MIARHAPSHRPRDRRPPHRGVLAAIGCAAFALATGWATTAQAADVAPDAIIGGRTTQPDEFTSVVAIVSGTPPQQSLCTATIVSERVALTAAHCLVELQSTETVSLHWGPMVEAMQGVAAARIGTHPEFCADCKEDIHDFGFVEIDGTFDVEGLLLPITDQDEWDDLMREGHDVTVVGYGEDPAVSGGGLGIKREVDTPISRFSKEGLEFYAGGDDHDSCRGDSGGPAFARLPDGTIRLAGVTSRGSDPCGKGGYYGAPYAGLCWLRDEAGVDLVPDGCDSCDCLDTAPPDDEGCRIGRGAGGSPGGSAALGWLLLFAAFRRRRDR